MLNDIIATLTTRDKLYTVSICHIGRTVPNKQESGVRDYFKKQKILQG
ncbi:hypothetical protein MtrunA17_Chr3g0081271 [Medicago truncatula]|uniref:Uncharacterized protein n=1 Tax=Medicago truncatula TaxID=3880 RepID=A0A396IRJ2_MEDTR|nr:hypothetical protein MtrunA17_Chr3g0081271 [Medicago truncatula]